MGLIDNVRKNRDSWTKRFEEHREEEHYDHEYEKNNKDKIEEQIERRKKMVGVFPDIDSK